MERLRSRFPFYGKSLFLLCITKFIVIVIVKVIVFQQAKAGIYHVIGDRLRMNPQLLIQNIEDGPGAVLNGSYAYMNVSNELK